MENFQNILDEIGKLSSNSKKDSQLRKTPQYVEDRLQKIADLKKSADEYYAKLRQRSNPKEEEQEIFNNIQKQITEFRDYLSKCPKAQSQSQQSGNRDEQNDFITSRMNWQKIDIANLIEELEKIKVSTNTEFSKTVLKQKKMIIEEEWKSIIKTHNELKSYKLSEDECETMQNSISELKNIYYEVLIKIEEKIETYQSKIVLNPVKIPQFDGKYENWLTFYDLFNKSIHCNNSLSGAEKMQYLKSNLKEEPAKIIQHLYISDVNYTAAWNLIQNRYNNERLIINKLIAKMYDLPRSFQESSEQIKLIHDTMAECLQAIKNLGCNTDTWDPFIIFLISKKWDPETNRIYEQTLETPNKLQKLEKVSAFLLMRFQSLESMERNKAKEKPQYSKNYCKYCKNNSHNLMNCNKFKIISPTEKVTFVKESHLCNNCLEHDSSKKCLSTNRCRICKKFHHTILHIEQKEKQKPSINMATESKKSDVLLATSVIRATSNSGNLETLRVLIDSGSQTSFITEEASQTLGLPKQKIYAEIAGLGEGDPKIAKSMITVNIRPRFPSTFQMDCELLVLKKITSPLPKQRSEDIEIEDFRNNYLADPTYNIPGPIDILLGAPEYSKLIKHGFKKLGEKLLAQNTELGWTLCGNTKIETTQMKATSLMLRSEEDQQLIKFWESEEMEQKKQLSKENTECEEFYDETTTKGEDGKYTVRIPFKMNPQSLGNSRNRAAARLIQMEKRLDKDNELKSEYHNFMKEYLELGHMKLVSYTNKQAYYIPHQAVVKPDSTTTKLRVVFDASSRTSSGQSLNTLMHTGPRIQKELMNILLRWRIHKFAITADIEKMYRQIWIHPEDQDYQRILWRFNTNEPIQEYKLLTVTYGTTSAPYLAVKTLKRLAIDSCTKYSKAAAVTLRDFYVDDVLSGANTIEEAIDLQRELLQMLQSAGFNLRKWSSNDIRILNQVPEESRDEKTRTLDADEAKRSLGILWNPKEDAFRFQIVSSTNDNLTKREILSEIAKLFDPLGWLAPVIINAKLMIQELWLRQLEWDKEVPEDIKCKWIQFRNNLKSIGSIALPRWIHYEHKGIQLHGFADASEKAFGAVIYARTEENGTIRTTLLISKSKVAPIKMKKTLPRLELCAAALLANLMEQTIGALEISDHKIFAWTDSMITLAWIKGEPTRWKTFVANRVAEITQRIQPNCWNHVRSQDNPADLVSRGIDPSKLENEKLWWNGPVWLSEQQAWPSDVNIMPTNEEAKICFVQEVVIKEELASRFSSFQTMLRVTAYCIRFIRNCQVKSKNTERLSVNELNRALMAHIRESQKLYFPSEIKSLRKNGQVETSSKIITLRPFLDENQLLQVGGRLKNATMLYDEKHPFILSKESCLSTLVIRDAHAQTLHGGNQQTLAYSRRRFWIINGKTLTRQLLHRCTICIRYKGQTSRQLMGELPEARVNQSRPFTHSGVDYAGPVNIRMSKGRGNKSYKGYIAIFVCLATKAVHIEVVSDMTSGAFLAAYRRFVARRGCALHMYSDNGTTFVGTAKVFSDEIAKIINETQDKLTTIGTQWNFIPPSAPHFGGIWEAAVKSMKHHLKRVVGDTTLTYEELSTLTQQVEACLNSRPLWPLTNDSNDMVALTPGHFLIGEALVTPTSPISTDVLTDQSIRWKLVQKLKKDFWKAWHSEYLNQLQPRYKWQHKENNVEIGDLVIVKDDNVSPGYWPLARIADVYAGADGVVRVVDIKQANGKTHKRPITKLIPLKIDNNDQSEQKLTSDNSKTSVINLSISLILMLMFINPIHANFTLKIAHPGLYLEHIGTARINRGTFRLELQFATIDLWKDASNMNRINKQMQDLCNETKIQSDVTHCDEWLHHLGEKQYQFQWIIKSINIPLTSKKKRGILGKFLTSVFGVNEEVYQDIDALEKNQNALSKLSNHQTKMMLSALSTFNDTERRIEERLTKLTQRYNDSIKYLNDISSWYKIIDHNQLNLKLLNTFQLVGNYFEEVLQKWNRILNIILKHGHIYELITPAHVADILKKTSQKLPTNLEILQSPIQKTVANISSDVIHIYSYFIIQDVADFEVSKITPIPKTTNDGKIWIIDSRYSFLAADYNAQLYFEMDEVEYSKCMKTSESNFVCSPVAVDNMDTNPNCIIDEIYNRNAKKTCRILELNLVHAIWKPLYMTNTWLCITNKSTHIAIICNGIREEITINTTSIVKVSSNCSIHTKESILPSRITTTAQVTSSFLKPVDINFDSTSSYKSNHIHSQFQPENILTNNNQQLHDVYMQETRLQDDIHNMVWKTIHHHSIMTSGILISAGLVIGLIIWLIIWWIKRKNTQDGCNRDPVTNQEAVPLREINVTTGPRPPPRQPASTLGRHFRSIRLPRQDVQRNI